MAQPPATSPAPTTPPAAVLTPRRGHRMLALLPPLMAAVLCLILALVLLACLGYSPSRVLETVWTKMIWPQRRELRLVRWAEILRAATPILLTGLSLAVAFRASVWNIGAQGQYLLGAIAAAAIGLSVAAPAPIVLPLVLMGACLGGAMLAAIAAALDWWRRVPVVLSTLLLNFIAQYLLRFLLQGPMREAGGQPQTELLPDAAILPFIPHTTLHAGFVLALMAAAIVAFILRKTTFGFRLRIVGENPVAARFAGISVPRVGLATLALSGALAGLAGGVEVSGVTHQVFLDDVSNPFGFTGIAVALLGRLSPAGVVAAALFLGFLNSVVRVLQAELRLPYPTAQALQGAIIILMLICTHPSFAARLRKLLGRREAPSPG